MSPRNARGRAKSLTKACRARVARRACGVRDEGNDDNYQESVMGRGASAPRGSARNVRVASPAVFGGAKFMQGVFTAIEQVVRNTVQTMQVLIRAADSRATTAMKVFLQLRPHLHLRVNRIRWLWKIGWSKSQEH